MRFVWCNNMGVRHELPIHHGRLHRPQESFHSLDWTPSPTRCEMKHEMWEESRGNYPRTCCMYTALYRVPLHPSSRVFYHTIQCRRIVTNIQHGQKLAKMNFGVAPPPFWPPVIKKFNVTPKIGVCHFCSSKKIPLRGQFVPIMDNQW